MVWKKNINDGSIPLWWLIKLPLVNLKGVQLLLM